MKAVTSTTADPVATSAVPFLFRGRWLRRFFVGLLHILLWSCAFLGAAELRFDGAIPAPVLPASRIILLCLIVFRLAAFVRGGLFDGLYRYSGMPALRSLITATTAATLLTFGVVVMTGMTGVPRSLFVGEWLLSIAAVGGMRMVVRYIHERRRVRSDGTPTLVIGAGDAGESLVRSVQQMREGAGWRVVGFLDDNPKKHGRLIHHVRVIGPANEQTLRAAVQRSGVTLVVLAIPTATGNRVGELVRLCRDLGVRAKTVPSLAELLSGENVAAVREIAIEDVLGRDPVQLDVAQLAGFLGGKTVLITGAGGSIGSELARQVLRFKPRQLLLLDHDETAVFFLERELRAGLAADAAPEVIKPLIVDITNERRVGAVFEHYRPQVVLHAAAHKHVAMMEANSCEAAWNNVFGTQTLAEAAHAAGTASFVFISTDKAVNPTSVMGATKRVCEMVIQHVAQGSETRFAAVRFGNVLGSNGSVVPLFREQIARGGPVTVTHPDVTRYFMTIPEAAQLVLQAGALGRTGETFLLDMGKPVKIVDLARDLIELSGLRPGIDIKIEFTGLKPGEKLFEEMLLEGESSERRPHPQIVVGRARRITAEAFKHGMGALAAAIRTSNELDLRRALSQLIPEATLAVCTQTDPAVRILRIDRTREHAVSLEDSNEMAVVKETPRAGSRRIAE